MTLSIQTRYNNAIMRPSPNPLLSALLVFFLTAGMMAPNLSAQAALDLDLRNASEQLIPEMISDLSAKRSHNSKFGEMIRWDLDGKSGITFQDPQEEATAVPLSPVVTSTPGENGIIIHTVQFGETLWTIAEAYGIPINEILQNTGLSLATTEVFEGQELIIQKATDPTPTVTSSATPDPGTPTPTQPRPTMTPFPTRTPMPTFTPTPEPSFWHRAFGEGAKVGLGLIVFSAVGLVLVIYLGFLKKS